MSRSIILLGMMAAGKSTTAVLVARRLGRELIDTDAQVERLVGATIPAIFSAHGEARFRELEREAVAAISDRDDAVIALGGGAVLDAANVELLRRHGYLVHLAVPVEVIAARLASVTSETPSRPLLAGGDLRERLDRILAERGPLYDDVAEITVAATAEPDGVAQRVITAALSAGDVLTPSEHEEVME